MMKGKERKREKVLMKERKGKIEKGIDKELKRGKDSVKGRREEEQINKE